MDPMWVLIASFFLILRVLILINAQVNGAFKVETSWIAVALSPTIIWLLTTGQLAELSGFGFAFKLREAPPSLLPPHGSPWVVQASPRFPGEVCRPRCGAKHRAR